MFRSRRVKKWAIVFGILFFLFLAYRLPLYFAVQSRIAEIRIQGRPTTLDDIKAWSTALPPDENSADELVELFEQLDWDFESVYLPLRLLQNHYRQTGGVNFSADSPIGAEIQLAIEDNRGVIDRLRELSIGHEVRWPWADDYIGYFRVPTSELYSAMYLLTFDAIVASDVGECSRAASSLALAVKLGRANGPSTYSNGAARAYLLDVVSYGVLRFVANGCADDTSTGTLREELVRESTPPDLVTGVDIERAFLIHKLVSTPFSLRFGKEVMFANLINDQIPALGWCLSFTARCSGLTDAMLLRLLDATDEWRDAAEIYQRTGDNTALTEFGNRSRESRDALVFIYDTWEWTELIDSENRRVLQAASLLSMIDDAAQQKVE